MWGWERDGAQMVLKGGKRRGRGRYWIEVKRGETKKGHREGNTMQIDKNI